MRKFLMFLTIATFAFTACKSPVKQNEDSIYSRHLQRHVPLTIITTPMPKDKAEMNLLLFIGDKAMLESTRAKKIIDSLYKKKLIQPLTLVSFEGKDLDYGLEETDGPAGKEYKQFNDFVADELYTFVKKKVVIRKFRSVVICGFGRSALSSYDIAWNNDEKIQKAGMFYPSFSMTSKGADDSTTFQLIQSSRKRPNLSFWITEDDGFTANAEKFKEIMDPKKNISETAIIISQSQVSRKLSHPVINFADFLVWAFPK